MRRERDLRDHRDALRRKAANERDRRRAKGKIRITLAKQKHRQKIAEQNADRIGVVAREKFNLALKHFDNYECTRVNPIKVCHVIDSLGLGGGQTMMMELIQGLNKYYPGKIENIIVCARPTIIKWDRNFYHSYGLDPVSIREKELGKFVSKGKYDIVLHHRIAVAKCLKKYLPPKVKYILLNHTFHQLAKIPNFLRCDLYITVCKYLHAHTKWPSVIHPSRRLVVLNGVENEYVAKLPVTISDGDFKTGRCHRLVQTKFKPESLTWMEKKVKKHIPGHHHYLIGHNGESKRLCKKFSSCTYVGPVNKRGKKMSVIKGLDAYFYETFQHEGASVAILEALACGIPVLCKNYGGNAELVRHGINGFIVKDRGEFLIRMKDLANDKEKLNNLKSNTLKDFDNRLHIKHVACKYMQIFETILS